MFLRRLVESFAVKAIFALQGFQVLSMPEASISKRAQPPGVPPQNPYPIITHLNLTSPDAATSLHASGQGAAGPSTTSWGTQWPVKLTIPISRLMLPPSLGLPPSLTHVFLSFGNPGRMCEYDGQKEIFDKAYHGFVRGWPRLPPPPEQMYRQHSRAFDSVVDLTFEAGDWLMSSPYGHKLWFLTEVSIAWLKSLYTEKGYISTDVQFHVIPDSEESKLQALGTFRVDVKEPPKYDEDLSWSLFLQRAPPIELKVQNEHDPGTHLVLDHLNSASGHLGFWTDADPIRRKYAAAMLRFEASQMRHKNQHDAIDLRGFQRTAGPVDYYVKVLLVGAQPRWPVRLTADILATLGDLIEQFGLVGVVLEVFEKEISLGFIELGSEHPPLD